MSPSRALLLQETECLVVALDTRDAYTSIHCSRVEALSLLLGQRCRLSDDELDLLRIAAKLHDIGKIGIPDRILHKPGCFDPDESEIMKTHTILGESICGALPHEDSKEIADAVRHHHEDFDGKGYPDGLSGEAIPVAARVITIVDGYDAMTTLRPYHHPRAHTVVMEMLADGSGHKIDPYIFGHFERVIAHSEYRAI